MSRWKELFKKTSDTEQTEEKTSAPSVPQGLWMKCPKCGDLQRRCSRSILCMSKMRGIFPYESQNKNKIGGR